MCCDGAWGLRHWCQTTTCVHLCSVFISGTFLNNIKQPDLFPNSFFQSKKGRFQQKQQIAVWQVPGSETTMQPRPRDRSRLVVRRWQLTRAHKACAFPNLPSANTRRSVLLCQSKGPFSKKKITKKFPSSEVVKSPKKTKRTYQKKNTNWHIHG